MSTIPASNVPMRITTLGTCRVADPIAAAAQIRPIWHENNNVYGFAHTPKEILQQIDYLDGVKDFPAELGRFISSDGILKREERETPELFIVEISTLKEIIFDGWYLQINYMEQAFEEAQGLFEAFATLKSQRDVETRETALQAFPAYATLDELERRIMLEGYIRYSTREELEIDMMAIVQRLPAPVLFVNHINIPGSDGELVTSRSRICGWIREICQRRGFQHFDPTPHVQKYGLEHALADINHYTADFKPIIGSHIIDSYVNAKPRRSRQAKGRDPTPQIIETPSEAEDDDTQNLSEILAISEPPPEAFETSSTIAPDQLSAATSAAKKAIADGDLDEAEAILHRLSLEDHRCALVHTLLGTIAFHRGDTAAAIAQLRQSVALDANALEPRVMLVKSALRMNKLNEACSIAAELVRRAPDNARVLLVSSKAMMRAKRYTDAISIWRRIGYLQPELVMPHIEIARCELKLRNFEAALAAADDALFREPREPSALVIKSDALQKLKRMKELAEVSMELATIDPSAAMAAVPALVSGFHPEEAAQIVSCASQTGEVDIDAVMRAGLIQALERRGKVADERGDVTAAANAWKAILLIDPESERAVKGLRRLLSPIVAKARAATESGDLTAAARFYASALEIQNDNERILRELATLHEKMSDWIGASQCWKKVADLTKRTDHALRAARLATRGERYDIAVPIYQSLDRDEQTERAFESGKRKLARSMRNDLQAGDLDSAAAKALVVLQTDPNSEPGQRVIHKVMRTYSRRLREAIASQDWADQEDICRKMLAIDPLRADALKALAKLYRSAKRHRDGIEILRRLTEIEPEDTKHWLNLARTCRAIRLYDRGVPAALKALEIEPGNLETVNLLSDMLNRQAAAA
jgi:tetratricopeptide (TPR) repeat protein